MLTPYPLVYTPKGTPKPASCAHPAPMAVYDGRGADAVVAQDGTRSGGGGLCWGAPFDETLPWVKTRAGWWTVLDGHLPQNTRRLVTHPRILRWIAITGAQPDHVWRVPVLLTPSVDIAGTTWQSACDRLYNQDGWRDADDLAALQQPLLAIAQNVRQHQDEKANNAALTEIAISLLSLGHWIDADLLEAAGWLSETMIFRILVAAIDRIPSHDPLHTHR